MLSLINKKKYEKHSSLLLTIGIRISLFTLLIFKTPFELQKKKPLIFFIKMLN